MGMICPLQNAQPKGAKLKPNTRISARNGSAMGASALRGENAFQRDDEVHAQERLTVLVRLASALCGHQRRWIRHWLVPAELQDRLVGVRRQECVCRAVDRPGLRRRELVRVGGGRRRSQDDLLLPATL